MAMSNWRKLGQMCGAIGVFMSAMSITLGDILPHPVDEIFVAIQTGIIALGVYALSSNVPQTEPAAPEPTAT